MKLLDVVALNEDLPEKNLKRGQVGTIVEELAEGVYEIEFSDLNGVAYAFVAVQESKLMPLIFEPVA